MFAHRRAAKVTRYDLPLLHAFNFVIDDVLEGGVNGSLNLDGHGKTNSFRLLGLQVEVPPQAGANVALKSIRLRFAAAQLRTRVARAGRGCGLAQFRQPARMPDRASVSECRGRWECARPAAA